MNHLPVEMNTSARSSSSSLRARSPASGLPLLRPEAVVLDAALDRPSLDGGERVLELIDRHADEVALTRAQIEHEHLGLRELAREPLGLLLEADVVV